MQNITRTLYHNSLKFNKRGENIRLIVTTSLNDLVKRIVFTEVILFMKQTQKELYANGTYQKVMHEKNIKYHAGTLYKANERYKIDVEGFTSATTENITECLKINANRKQKTNRLKDRTVYWKVLRDKSTEVYFLTCTCTDEILSSTTKETRKQQIRRILSDNCIDFFGNIDYGKTNNREHYHFIIVVENGIKITKELSKLRHFGQFSIKRVNGKWFDTAKLSNYIDKLSIHALKIDDNANMIAKRSTDYHKWYNARKKLRELGFCAKYTNEGQQAINDYKTLTDYPNEITDIDGKICYEYIFGDDKRARAG